MLSTMCDFKKPNLPKNSSDLNKNNPRDELQKLRQEESHYLHLVESGKRQLDTLIANLKIVQSDTNVV